MQKDKSKPDPNKVFQVIADIIGEREGLKINVKSVKKKSQIENIPLDERGTLND